MPHVSMNLGLMVKSITRIKSGITISVGVSVKMLKNNMSARKIISGILLCIVDDSVITCDEIIETTKIVPTNFNEKR